MSTSLVQVNPASGDDHATLFNDSGEALANVDSGTILKVISDNGDTMSVAYTDPNAKNVAFGGGGLTGMIAASPHTFLYTDPHRKTVVSMINNGTPIEIIDEDEALGMFKVSGQTVDGMAEGWIQYRYVFRDPMSADENV